MARKHQRKTNFAAARRQKPREKGQKGEEKAVRKPPTGDVAVNRPPQRVTKRRQAGKNAALGTLYRAIEDDKTARRQRRTRSPTPMDWQREGYGYHISDTYDHETDLEDADDGDEGSSDPMSPSISVGGVSAADDRLEKGPSSNAAPPPAPGQGWRDGPSAAPQVPGGESGRSSTASATPPPTPGEHGGEAIGGSLPTGHSGECGGESGAAAGEDQPEKEGNGDGEEEDDDDDEYDDDELNVVIKLAAW